MDEIRKTCLYDKHVALHAKMEPFAGWLMPIEYSGIIAEHTAVRTKSGMFDVSHMGEIRVKGPDALRYIDYVTTNEIASKPDGKVVYGMMLYPNGTVVDDLLTYKVSATELFLVVNASNVAKDYAWLVEQTEGFDVVVKNLSDEYGEVAVQGPATEALLRTIMGIDLSDLEAFTFKHVWWDGHDLLVSRTGYTGEDGFEIYADPVATNVVWDILAASTEILPCGLGCRDTLRFEAALPLYGHEISDEITALEAGLGFFVKLEKPDFIGKTVLVDQKAGALKRKVVGIELTERAVPRAHYEVYAGETKIGFVTTGYLSISAGKPVAMAMLDLAYTPLNTPIQVQIRNKKIPGFVRDKKFFKKSYKPKGDKANE
ncbi:MAG TPA: glycine cleavage system aminomethyltransferase GcvT [Acholeplasmatales bacterium]|nr:MAG: glycine cleavage system protein T [Tenericutes bacterium GWF2_57_13]HAQ56194.1 glycine cleavage system aminomethyltransferase GcvT [Acholeplasmatales bacterium]